MKFSILITALILLLFDKLLAECSTVYYSSRSNDYLTQSNPLESHVALGLGTETKTKFPKSISAFKNFQKNRNFVIFPKTKFPVARTNVESTSSKQGIQRFLDKIDTLKNEIAKFEKLSYFAFYDYAKTLKADVITLESSIESIDSAKEAIEINTALLSLLDELTVKYSKSVQFRYFDALDPTIEIMQTFAAMCNVKNRGQETSYDVTLSSGTKLQLVQFNITTVADEEAPLLTFKLTENIEIEINTRGLNISGQGTQTGATVVYFGLYRDFLDNYYDFICPPMIINIGNQQITSVDVHYLSKISVNMNPPIETDDWFGNAFGYYNFDQSFYDLCVFNRVTSKPTQAVFDCKNLYAFLPYRDPSYKEANHTLDDFVELWHDYTYDSIIFYPFETTLWKRWFWNISNFTNNLLANPARLEQIPIDLFSRYVLESLFEIVNQLTRQHSLWTDGLSDSERLYYAMKMAHFVGLFTEIETANISPEATGSNRTGKSNLLWNVMDSARFDATCNCMHITGFQFNGYPQCQIDIPRQVLDGSNGGRTTTTVGQFGSKLAHTISFLYFTQIDMNGAQIPVTVHPSPYIAYGKFAVASAIVVLRLRNQKDAVQVPDPYRITLRFANIKPTSPTDTVSCGSWDDKQAKWLIDGCNYLAAQSTNWATVCECNYIGLNYAVLFNAASQTDLPDILAIVDDIQALAQNLTSNDLPLTPQHWFQSFDTIVRLLSNISRPEMVQFVGQLKVEMMSANSVRTLARLILSTEGLTNLTNADKLVKGSALLGTIEDLAVLRNTNGIFTDNSDSTISMQHRLEEITNGDAKFAFDKEYLSISMPGLAEFAQDKSQLMVSVTLLDKTAEAFFSSGNFMLNSRIISVTVENERESIPLVAPNTVSILLEHIKPLEDGDKALCGYWVPEQKVWSTDGCHLNQELSNSTHSYCECEHLTDFAVLSEAPMNNRAVASLAIESLLTYVCLCLAMHYTKYLF